VSVRAVAVRGIPASRLRAAPRDPTRRRSTARPGVLARLTDDRDLIAFKLVLLGILLIAGAVLEVPP